MASTSDLKRIKKYVDNMNLDNLKHIYNIITKNNQPITRKSDCFLINLGNLNNETISEIITFINFIESNTKILEEDEKVRHEYEEIVKQYNEKN
jgi:hypothetical protein